MEDSRGDLRDPRSTPTNPPFQFGGRIPLRSDREFCRTLLETILMMNQDDRFAVAGHVRARQFVELLLTNRQSEWARSFLAVCHMAIA